MKTTELFVEQTLTGFPDTLRERFNRWNRLLFAIELKKENKAWWRTTETFMQFLRDFRKWAREK
jgi:hypothetical protein